MLSRLLTRTCKPTPAATFQAPCKGRSDACSWTGAAFVRIELNSSGEKDSRAMLPPLPLSSEFIPASQHVSPDSTTKPLDVPLLIPGAIFKEGEFWVVQPSREARQFSFFSEEEEEKEEKVKLRDPGLFHARLQAKRKHRNRRRRIQGSYSQGGRHKPSKLKYAFLKPEPY